MKGISPLIAAVLLIAFTMAIAALVGVFGTTFSKGETEKISSSAQCVGALQIDPLSIRFSQITRRVTGRMTNYGKGTLDNFLVTVYYPDSTSITKNITDNITAGSSKALSIHTGTSSIPEKVSVFAENCGPSYSASLKISSDKIINGRYDYTTDPDIIACYNFESGFFTNDSCGNNDLTNNGVVADIANYQWGLQSAEFEYAFNDALTCTDVACPSIDFNGPDKKITLMAWVHPGDVGGSSSYGGFVVKGWNNQPWQIARANNDNVRFSMAAYNSPGCDWATQTIVMVDVNLTLNVWQHITGVSDNIKLRLYSNGTQVGETPYSDGVCDGSEPFNIGAMNSGSSTQQGDFDEVAVFTRALSAKEVCEICRFGLDGTNADRGVQCNSCAYA